MKSSSLTGINYSANYSIYSSVITFSQVLIAFYDSDSSAKGTPPFLLIINQLKMNSLCLE